MDTQEPATIRYARAFYEVLNELATDEVITDVEPNATTVTLRIFRGNVSQVFASLGISQTYVKKIRALLIEQDCIEYVQRGNRGQESVLVLNHPLPHDFNPSASDILQTKPLTTPDELATLRRKVEVLTARLEGIALKETIANHEQRLRKVEAQLNGTSTQDTEPT